MGTNRRSIKDKLGDAKEKLGDVADKVKDKMKDGVERQ